MTRHFRSSTYYKYDGSPTNQCKLCGARFLASESRCPFHADVEVWVRGALVRFTVILWPPDPNAGLLGSQPEVLDCELVGHTHARAYALMSASEYGQLTDSELDAVLEAFWSKEEFEENCAVYHWRDWFVEVEDLFTGQRHEVHGPTYNIAILGAAQ